MSYPQQSSVQPGPEPGTIYVPGIGVQKITDWRTDLIYDAELMPVNIAAGQQFVFFRNLAVAGVNKTRRETNIITPSQLPYGNRAVIYGIHFHTIQTAFPDDAVTLLSNGYVEFITGDTKRERSGPIWSFPSPFGLTGFGVADGGGAPVMFAQVNNGVPSPSSIGKMEIPIDLASLMTFQCTLTFFTAQVLFQTTWVYCTLRAYINTIVR